MNEAEKTVRMLEHGVRRFAQGVFVVWYPMKADQTAETVLAELIAQPEAVTGPLRGHGAVATRRRWTRALTLPAVLLVAMVAPYSWTPVWLWPVWAVLAACCAVLACDWPVLNSTRCWPVMCSIQGAVRMDSISWRSSSSATR